MNIGIDAKCLATKKYAGPEVYTLNTIEALGKIDSKNEYIIYLAQGDTPQQALDVLKKLPENFSLKILFGDTGWTQKHLAREVVDDKIDVLFTARHTLPMKPVMQKKIKTVAVIHGLEYKTNKEQIPLWKKPLLGLPEKLVSKYADCLIAPSATTKTAIENTHWRSKDKPIKVIHEGVNKAFKPQTKQKVNAVLEKYDVPKDVPYILFVSTIQPRKNLEKLLEATAHLLKEGIKLNLVICGKRGWKYKKVLALPNKLGIQKNVRFLGHTPLDDLTALMTGTNALVSVSLDEGFGLPVIEAMACGTRLVLSDIPAYQEIAKDLAVFVDPQNVKEIANGIKKVIEESKETRETLIQRGFVRVTHFSWERSAKKILECIETIGNTNK